MLQKQNEEIVESTMTENMPVLFLGHGNPMNAIEENEFVAEFRKIGKTIPKPRAIVCISAHWETEGTQVTAMDNPPTIHDFGGFPRALYEVQYPAAGSLLLAQEIASLITKTEVGFNYTRGLDHGTWSVLKHVYPSANVPVIQMSLDFSQPSQYHYDLAKELHSLRKKGVLIVGSGNIVHNLNLVAWNRLNEEFGYDWALDAKEQMKAFILKDDHHALIEYQSQGAAFNTAIPSPEHYLPLLYILALKEQHEHVTFFNDKIVGGALAMTSLMIGSI